MAASEQYLYQTIVQFDKTIVLTRKPATRSIHDYFFCNCPIVGILFEVLRIIPKLNAHIDYLPCVLQVVVNKREMPHFSFGMRHSQYLAPSAVEHPM